MNDKYFSRDNLEMVIEGLKLGTKKNLDSIIDDLKQRDIPSDWSQNDETSLDFVKNRPFYSEVESMSETREFTDSLTDSEFIDLLVANKETALYTVNGVSYVFSKALTPPVGYLWELMADDGAITNMQILNGVINLIGEVSISVIYDVETVHKLDPKYLPERNVKVTVSTDADGNVIASHTPAEIYDAVMSGSIVTLEYNGLHFSLIQCLSDRSVFECTIGPLINMINVASDGVCTLTFTSAAPLDSVILPPSTASIGQTLVVKTIDENGKPIGWETVETQPDWNQSDSTAPDFIKNKPDVVLRSEIEEIDAIELVTELALVSPAAAEDGSIYTDENGALYSL